MTENTDPKVDIESIMQRIQAEVALRKANSQRIATGLSKNAKISMPIGTSAFHSKEHITLTRLPESVASIKKLDRYEISDFLNYHDEDFVRNAYRGILMRDVDPGGLTHYLIALRNSRLTKLEIIGRLRYSAEGRARNVQVSGLLPQFAIRTSFRIPILGYVLSLGNFIIRLPVLMQNWQRFETFVNKQQRDQRLQINGLITQIEDSFHIFQQRSTDEIRVLHDDLLKANTEVKDIRRIVAKKTDIVEFRVLAAQLANGLAQKADGSQLAELATQLTSGLAQKADGAQLAELKTQLTSGLAHKADGSQLAELATQLTSGLAQKADGSQLAELATQLTSGLAQKADGSQLAELATQLASGLTAKEDSSQIIGEISDIRQKIQEHKLNIVDTQRRITMLLEEARKRLPAPISQNQIETMLEEEDHLLDAFYVSLEDRFRGTREDIKKRSEVYVPVVRKAQAGTIVAPILDIGCGRGEWLEVLGENGLVAKGIDLNRIMVSHCQELNLDVSQAEAIEHLRSLKPNSLGAVTGIHIIEHIPFRQLVALLDEVLRVLKPGGVAIFETPNPENLIVGACNFYFDPTHLNPLPPPMIQFVAETRGFIKVEIERLLANRNIKSLMPLGCDESGSEIINPIIKIIQDAFYSAPDYAVFAYKA
ncbi:MAG: methyltransferase domain-containing protein [Acinetobacter sp.]|nr:methyltransferase domain-containing protein [Acinetobacter sp.]